MTCSGPTSIYFVSYEGMVHPVGPTRARRRALIGAARAAVDAWTPSCLRGEPSPAIRPVHDRLTVAVCRHKLPLSRGGAGAVGDRRPIRPLTCVVAFGGSWPTSVRVGRLCDGDGAHPRADRGIGGG